MIPTLVVIAAAVTSTTPATTVIMAVSLKHAMFIVGYLF
jgi:hypothetical protein